MATMMANVEKLEDRYLERVKQVEQPVLRFAGEASERMARFVPERPAFMADLPRMGEFVEGQLKFRKRLFDERLRFARKMIKAMDPVMSKVDHVPETPARRTKARAA